MTSRFTTLKRRTIPLFGALLAAAVAVAGCGGDSEGSGDTDASTLDIGIHVEPTEWSASRIQTILFPFTRQLYDSLIEYDDDLNPEPRLATEWVIDDAKTSVTITLRDDVVFHGGRAMTAEDVAANLEFFADPETGQQLFGPMAVVKDWVVVDDTTLQVNFTQPIAELQITDLLQSWTIGDPEAFDEVATRAVGTGPYSFVEWQPGERIVLERNDDYWGDAPAYAELDYRVFDDMDSLVAAFESKTIDLGVDVPALAAERLESSNTVLIGYPGALIDQWRINPTRPPFDNVDVRMALNYATDREAIMEALYHGYGEPVALPYSATSPAYDEELADSLGYDLGRAKTLLEGSGLSADQLTATISVSNSSATQQQAAQIMQASLDEIGFTLEIQPMDAAEYTENQLAGEFQLMYGGIGNAQKFPTRITTNSIYRVVDNPVGATDAFPDYAPAVDAANAAVTEADQSAAFAELNRVLTEAMWVPTVGYLPTLWLIAPEVTGVARNVDNMLLLGGAAPGQ